PNLIPDFPDFNPDLIPDLVSDLSPDLIPDLIPYLIPDLSPKPCAIFQDACRYQPFIRRADPNKNLWGFFSSRLISFARPVLRLLSVARFRRQAGFQPPFDIGRKLGYLIVCKAFEHSVFYRHCYSFVSRSNDSASVY